LSSEQVRVKDAENESATLSVPTIFMKKLTLALIIGLFASVVSAATLTFSWPNNAALENIELYKLYERVNNTTVLAGTSQTNFLTLTNVVPGRHAWFLTASNFWGESLGSPDASTPGVPSAPTQLRIDMTTNNLSKVSFPVEANYVYDLQSTESFTDWVSVATFHLPSNSVASFIEKRPGRFHFYRAVSF
jgi:hypothetical protein